MPFVESADGFQIERLGKVSLLGRAVALTTLLEIVEERKIVVLPYNEWLYLQTTDGKKFES